MASNGQYGLPGAPDEQVRERKLPLVYKNKIPLEIAAAFEKHGFIWGGKWYHFDGMHFEYRPESDHGKISRQDFGEGASPPHRRMKNRRSGWRPGDEIASNRHSGAYYAPRRFTGRNVCGRHARASPDPDGREVLPSKAPRCAGSP
jgi:D-alanyl-D-alanine carboxypeptidase